MRNCSPMDAEQRGREQRMSRQRLECVELAPALARLGQPQSASKLDAPQTLRLIRTQCRGREAFGVRWQAKRDTALARAAFGFPGRPRRPKAPSPLRSAGALQTLRESWRRTFARPFPVGGSARHGQSDLLRPNQTDQTKMFFEPPTRRCALRILISIWHRS